MQRSGLMMSALLAGLMLASPGGDAIHAATVVDPFAHLMGRWVGNGIMRTSSGPAEFKCVVTYLPQKDGAGLRQNLRCDNGASFKLQAATDLNVVGGKVSGRWKDPINEIEGTVDGAITPAGFEVDLASRFFAARMAVAGHGCDQMVKVLPVRSDMFEEFAATLKKC